jgi:hypothetical protein
MYVCKECGFGDEVYQGWYIKTNADEIIPSDDGAIDTVDMICLKCICTDIEYVDQEELCSQ